MAEEADSRPDLALALELLAEPQDYPGTMRRVAEVVVPRLGDLAAFDLILPDGAFQRIHVTAADPSLASVADELKRFPPRPGSEDLAARALASGGPIVIDAPDEAALATFALGAEHLRVLRDLAPRSILVVPLVADRPLGVLTCIRAGADAGAHAGGEIQFAAAIGQIAAIALCHAEMLCQRELLLARERAAHADAEAERAKLHDVEERRRLAVEAAEIGTWEYVPATGVFRSDARCKELFGLPPEAILDYDTFLDSIHPDDRDAADQAVRHALDPDSTGVIDHEFRAVDAEERDERWLRATGKTLFDPTGEATRFLGTLQDLGDRKRAALQIEAASRAKDEFMAMLGHELRNPLAPILTALDLMSLRAPQMFSREREIIARQVDHVVRLVDDLLDISRITRGKIELKRQPITLAQVIERGVELASPLLEKQAHRLTVEVTDVLRVDGDPARLAQAVSNLLANAAKYTEPGGVIEVRARADGDVHEIAVRDNGSGIAPELLPRVFDAFVQGDRRLERASGGLGLGLAIARSVVEMHGGTIAATSDGPARGSTFTIRLPRLGAEPHAEAASDAIDDRITCRFTADQMLVPATRVLIVDDNHDAAEVLAEALSATGYQTCVAYDAPQALDRAATFAPDIAVLDLGLPVMDGYELARRLRELPETRAVHLVAVSGYGQERDRQQSASAGFVAHLVKPVELARVQDLLGRIITGR